MDRILWDYEKKVFWSETTGQQVSIPYVDNFMVSIKEIENLKDKLHRRNMQIEDLKKKVGYKTIGEWKASDWEFWAEMEYNFGNKNLPEWFIIKMSIPRMNFNR
jgi:hypothetical protein